MAQKRRPKRSRSKRTQTSTSRLIFRIALTVLAVIMLSVVGYMVMTAKDPVKPAFARDAMILALSKVGIPATRTTALDTDPDRPGLRAAARAEQVDAIRKQLAHYLQPYAVRIHATEKGADVVISVHSGGRIYRLELAGAARQPEPEEPAPVRGKETESKPEEQTQPKLAGQPRVAIILDDVGLGSMKSFRQALEIPYPLTFAVIPFRRFTKECATMARGRGFEMIVHMPMEPYNYPQQDPGPGAIFEKDSIEIIEQKIQAALDSVMYGRGMNNHMGSKITALPFTMRVILSKLKREGLFFVDSRTTPDTVVIREATQLGVPAISRNVFLDNSRDPADIRTQLEEVIAIAKEQGYVVALGHNYPETIAVLEAEMPRLDREVNFVFVRELVDEVGQPD